MTLGTPGLRGAWIDTRTIPAEAVGNFRNSR